MRTLVYHTGGLGDFITMFPLLSRLKAAAPSVTLFGRPAFGALGKANNLIDDIIDVNSSRYTFLFSPCSNQQQISTFLSPFGTLVLFARSDSPIVGNTERCFTGHIYQQDPIPDLRIPVSEYRMRLLDKYDVPPDTRYPDLSYAISQYSKGDVEKTQIPAIAIHPGSGSLRKNWPFERFLFVADKLRSAGLSIWWFTGEAENHKDFPSSDRVMNHLDLTEAATILSRCLLYIGNDSGFSHVAGASGCPAVVLFGPSDPTVWAPHGRSTVAILHHPQECSPCHLIKTDNCNQQCLTSISVDEVVDTCYTLLQNG